MMDKECPSCSGPLKALPTDADKFICSICQRTAQRILISTNKKKLVDMATYSILIVYAFLAYRFYREIQLGKNISVFILVATNFIIPTILGALGFIKAGCYAIVDASRLQKFPS